MKKGLYILLLSLGLGFTMVSCQDDDGYSTGTYWLSLATVSENTGGAYYFTLDDGSTLWCANADVNRLGVKPEQRVLINYTRISDSHSGYDHFIRLNNIDTILCKNVFPISLATEDSIGDDPIQIQDAWVSGIYANFHYSFLGGEKRHMLNLTIDTTNLTDPITLELRHNAHGDSYSYRYAGYVSFKLESLRAYTQSDSVRFKVRYNSGNGEKFTPVFKYKFNR